MSWCDVIGDGTRWTGWMPGPTTLCVRGDGTAHEVPVGGRSKSPHVITLPTKPIGCRVPNTRGGRVTSYPLAKPTRHSAPVREWSVDEIG